MNAVRMLPENMNKIPVPTVSQTCSFIKNELKRVPNAIETSRAAAVRK